MKGSLRKTGVIDNMDQFQLPCLVSAVWHYIGSGMVADRIYSIDIRMQLFYLQFDNGSHFNLLM